MGCERQDPSRHASSVAVVVVVVVHDVFSAVEFLVGEGGIFELCGGLVLVAESGEGLFVGMSKFRVCFELDKDESLFLRYGDF